MKNLALLVISIAAVGCATSEPRYAFRPMGPAQAGDSGYPASRYQIPPQAPRGEAYVTSFGTRELEGGDGARDQLIHVRLAVANNNADGAWSIDPAQQTLSPPGGAPQRPDFMEVDGKAGTSAAIPRGQRRVFDLYYRVPGGAGAANLNGFDFNWKVNTGGSEVAERTAFARDVYRDDGYGYGPRTHVAVGVGMAPWWAYGYGPWGPWGPYGYGWYGAWGYPYYGPYYGVGLGWRGGYYGGYRGYHGGYHGGYGGGRIGGGGFGRGGGIHAPVTRGRPGR